MVRDTSVDIGTEPPLYTCNWWNSPDIILLTSPQPNKSCGIYVRVLNRGNRLYHTEDSAKLYLYWIKSEKKTNWSPTDTNWKLIDSVLLQSMDANGIQEYYAYITWNKLPDTANYPSSSKPWEFYLLAVINSKVDPYGLTSNIDSLIKFNNNVAGKTVNIGHQTLQIISGKSGFDFYPTHLEFSKILCIFANPIERCASLAQLVEQRIRNA